MAPATHIAPESIKQEISHQRRRGAVHPVAIEVGLAAAIWFIAVSWLSFAWDREVDVNLAVVTLFFVIFFTLFLLTASHAIDDPRWPSKAESFVSFLRDDSIAIDRGTMKGRDVFIEVTLIPVALAFAATLIGLAWVLFG